MAIRKHIFFSDPGHGWLKVSKKELEKLGISDKISGYSYMQNDSVFLEEDSDATKYINALLQKEKFAEGDYASFQNYCTTQTSNKQSKIRNYESYKLENAEEIHAKELLVAKILGARNWNKQARNKIAKASIENLKYW